MQARGLAKSMIPAPWRTRQQRRCFTEARTRAVPEGTRARRKPRAAPRPIGTSLPPIAAPQCVSGSRVGRYPVLRGSPSFACRYPDTTGITLPCMSYSPSLFGWYEPTFVGRPR